MVFGLCASVKSVILSQLSRTEGREQNQNLENTHTGFLSFNRIGRVRKNSIGKGQAYYQPQVTTGKRRQDRLLVLGECTHRSETSEHPLVRYLSGQTQRGLTGTRPAVFHCYFSLPPYWYIHIIHISVDIHLRIEDAYSYSDCRAGSHR